MDMGLFLFTYRDTKYTPILSYPGLDTMKALRVHIHIILVPLVL